MDIVHHAFIGAAGFVGLASQEQELAGLGFLVGSVLPDLDVAFMAAGKRAFLKRHQGPTHSLPLAPVYAALVAALAALHGGWHWSLYAGVLAGLSVHVMLDLFNTFGIQLGWPFTTRRFCLDAVFFIDAVAWALTLGYLGLALGGLVAPGSGAIAYAVLFAGYALGKLVLQRRVRAARRADFAIPSALNPFTFFLFARRDGELRTSRFNALTGVERDVGVRAEPAREVVELAGRSSLFRDMRSILRGLAITHAASDGAGTRILAEDLAVRNFGGRFGRTEVTLDAAGNVVDEMAHI